MSSVPGARASPVTGLTSPGGIDVTTMAMFRPASDGSSTGVIVQFPSCVIFAQNSSRERLVRDDTYTCSIEGKVVLMTRSDHTPRPPQPIRPSVFGGRGARYLAATEAQPAVRRNVTYIPSMMQHGRPWSGSLRMIMPVESGNPRFKLPGK